MDGLFPEGHNAIAYSGTGTPYTKGTYGSNAIYLSSLGLYNTYIIRFI